MRPEEMVAQMDLVAAELDKAKTALAKLWRDREACPAYDGLMKSIKDAIDVATDESTFTKFTDLFDYDREFVVTLTPLTHSDGDAYMYEAIMTEAGNKVDWNVWDPGAEGGAEEWADDAAAKLNGKVVLFTRITDAEAKEIVGKR